MDSLLFASIKYKAWVLFPVFFFFQEIAETPRADYFRVGHIVGLKIV